MEIITVTLGDIKRKKYDGDKNLIYHIFLIKKNLYMIK